MTPDSIRELKADQAEDLLARAVGALHRVRHAVCYPMVADQAELDTLSPATQ
jgi:hypothetical protein